eukprot:6178316-Pleurochrysis_carterae.AAC.3
MQNSKTNRGVRSESAAAPADGSVSIRISAVLCNETGSSSSSARQTHVGDWLELAWVSGIGLGLWERGWGWE